MCRAFLSPSKFRTDGTTGLFLGVFGSATPNTPHPPGLTASSELSFYSPSPSCPRGHQLKLHITSSLCILPPLTPSSQIPAPAEVPGRAQPLLSSDCSTPEAFAFLPPEGNKSDERNDGAICSRSLSPALTGPFVFVTLSHATPVPFPWHPQEGGNRSIEVHPFVWKGWRSCF